MIQTIIPPNAPDPLTSQHDAKLRQIELIAELMDNRFTLPGTDIRLGLDVILGLVPVIGDTLSSAVSFYILKLAHELGVPAHVKARMAANIGMDWVIGLVPFIGDAFDISWKANRKNAALVKKHLSP